MSKKITLKKLNVQEVLSEETLCFSADLYEDNKLVAHVSNSGHGGGNLVRPAEGLKYEDVAHLDTLDVECDILELAEEMNIVKKNQGRKLILKKDGKIYLQRFKGFTISQLKKSGKGKMFLDDEIEKATLLGYEILNTNVDKTI